MLLQRETLSLIVMCWCWLIDYCVMVSASLEKVEGVDRFNESLGLRQPQEDWAWATINLNFKGVEVESLTWCWNSQFDCCVVVSIDWLLCYGIGQSRGWLIEWIWIIIVRSDKPTKNGPDVTIIPMMTCLRTALLIIDDFLGVILDRDGAERIVLVWKTQCCIAHRNCGVII